ncbi:MAG: hypothetical protein GY754_46370 [bacterium]|nr:hypothetical protein [bacterium]
MSEIISLAEQKGLYGVTVSDHDPSLGCRNEHDFVLAPDDNYFNVFCNRFVNTNAAVRLYKGIEMNILHREPWVSPLSPVYSHLFDLKLAGIHSFRHLFQKSADTVRNTDSVLKAIHAGDRRQFHIMTHPVMPSVPLDMKTVISACKERNIAVELNNASLAYNKAPVESTREMLELAAEQGCCLSVGSDAHTPHEVGLFDSATSLLEKIDFPPQLIINRSVETLDRFLRESDS